MKFTTRISVFGERLKKKTPEFLKGLISLKQEEDCAFPCFPLNPVWPVSSLFFLGILRSVEEVAQGHSVRKVLAF